MTYKFNSIVNKTEAEALKEMIFRRVKERTESINADVQGDVMDLARNSFVSNNNPFSKISKDDELSKDIQEKSNSEQKSHEDSLEVGFPKRKGNLHLKNDLINQQAIEATISANMEDARAGLSNKKSFMGALNFLNTQAAISLIRTRADKFEIVV